MTFFVVWCIGGLALAVTVFEERLSGSHKGVEALLLLMLLVSLGPLVWALCSVTVSSNDDDSE